MATKKATETESTSKKSKKIATWEELVQSINKEAGSTIVVDGLQHYDYERIPFTSPRMNYCTFGGIPEGRLTEFYGPEHGGKTTTLCDVIANFQQKYPDRKVLLVDVEHSFDTEWAEKIGVDLSRLTILVPEEQGAETIFGWIEDFVKTGKCGLWGLDSIGAMVSNADLENDMDESTYGGISKSLTKFGNRINPLLKKYNCTGIAINQERENLNSPYGGPITPGGKNWKYLCSVRLRFTQGAYLDEKGNELSKNSENPAGIQIVMNMKKNKPCPPTRRVGQYTIDFEIGIDYFKDLIDVAMKYGIVDKHGSWYEVVDVTAEDILAEKIQGLANLYDYLEENIETLKKVEELVDIKMNEKQ